MLLSKETERVNPSRGNLHAHSREVIEPYAIPVIVIDAVDECGSDSSQAGQRRVFLDTITHWSCLPEMLKLIMTGHDKHLPRSFRTSCKQIELSTGEEVTADAKRDVHQFLEQRFADIGGPSLADWPGIKILDIYPGCRPFYMGSKTRSRRRQIPFAFAIG
jgi:hypothetical protein